MQASNLVTRLGSGRGIAAALGLSLVLGLGLEPPARPVSSEFPVPVTVMPPVRAVATTPTPPPRTEPAVCPAPTAAIPDANAADLVGIYHSRACTLTLDASGTYVSDCGGHHASRYTVSGKHVVLGAQRLRIAASGRLVAADGTSFSITEGAR